MVGVFGGVEIMVVVVCWDELENLYDSFLDCVVFRLM